MPVIDKLPRPDWKQIYHYIETNRSSQDQGGLLNLIVYDWMDKTVQHLGHCYTKTESKNFILISSKEERYNQSLISFLERSRARLMHIAKGIVSDQGWGKHLVIVFADMDSYYDYVSHYGPQEGTYGLSSGMYLNYGYGHFVFQNEDLDNAEPIAAHEMTHALLAHLPIPVWLNEGMAVNMESMICGRRPPPVTQSMFEQHQTFWREQRIQEFWSGDAFFRPDQGQQLSYEMAQVLVTNLSKNYSAFQRFANKAHYADGGEAAMLEVYDVGLGDLATGFLGHGSWQPTPDRW